MTLVADSQPQVSNKLHKLSDLFLRTNITITLMENPFDNFKRLRIFDELFLALGNGKIIVKDLKKPNEHQTIFFRPNGILDVHKTKEGSKKEYESLGSYDLLKSVAKMASNPNEIIIPLIQTLQSMKEVNFQESEYEHLQVSPIATPNEMRPTCVPQCDKVNILLTLSRVVITVKRTT